jgi:Glycerophosphoryl diester phosphodiesterase family
MSSVIQVDAGLPLLAHRGYAMRYPENTREALRAAVAAGARHLEFDIQLSADRVPFLLHDADFQRTAGIDRTIFSTPAADVAAIAAGEPQRFGKQFDDVRVPRLARSSTTSPPGRRYSPSLRSSERASNTLGSMQYSMLYCLLCNRYWIAVSLFLLSSMQ